MKLVLNIAFLGTGYCGYQVQPNGITIQQRLCEAANKLFEFDCDITGCSRTDSGVHANDFCVSVCEKGKNKIHTEIKENSIVKALNTFLPSDIVVKSARWEDDDFHPRYSVKYKEYIYRIYNAPVPSPFESGRVFYYPKFITDSMVDKMNISARLFEGKHDFKSFMASGSKITNTERTVYNARVFRENDTVVFSVAADGFLYNMVRIMAGTLIEVAEGKIDSVDIPYIINSFDRSKAGRTLPACGLYLNKVVY